jgi:hypothetical protein
MMLHGSHSITTNQPERSENLIKSEVSQFGSINSKSMPMKAIAPRENAADRTKHFHEK